MDNMNINSLYDGLYSVLDDKNIETDLKIKSEGIKESTFTLIDSIIETKNYISTESISEVNIKVKPNNKYDRKVVDIDEILLNNSFLYTTYTYEKGDITIGVIVIYNAFEKTFRTITTTKYSHNYLHVIGYLKTLEYAKECNATVVNIYTDNEMPSLINNSIIDTWLALNCMIDGKMMPIRPFIQQIKETSMSFKKDPIAKRLDVNNNKILLLLKNISVKIALNILADLKGDYKLKARRMELDIEIARLSVLIFSKPVTIFESNDIDFE